MTTSAPSSALANDPALNGSALLIARRDRSALFLNGKLPLDRFTIRDGATRLRLARWNGLQLETSGGSCPLRFRPVARLAAGAVSPVMPTLPGALMRNRGRQARRGDHPRPCPQRFARSDRRDSGKTGGDGQTPFCRHPGAHLSAGSPTMYNQLSLRHVCAILKYCSGCSVGSI